MTTIESLVESLRSGIEEVVEATVSAKLESFRMLLADGRPPAAAARKTRPNKRSGTHRGKPYPEAYKARILAMLKTKKPREVAQQEGLSLKTVEHWRLYDAKGKEKPYEPPSKTVPRKIYSEEEKREILAEGAKVLPRQVKAWLASKGIEYTNYYRWKRDAAGKR